MVAPLHPRSVAKLAPRLVAVVLLLRHGPGRAAWITPPVGRDDRLTTTSCQTRFLIALLRVWPGGEAR